MMQVDYANDHLGDTDEVKVTSQKEMRQNPADTLQADTEPADNVAAGSVLVLADVEKLRKQNFPDFGQLKKNSKTRAELLTENLVQQGATKTTRSPQKSKQQELD